MIRTRRARSHCAAAVLASRLTLVGPGPALLYREICELTAEQPPRATATHQVAHLLREVESAVRYVLRPAKLATHREEVLATLDEMGIAHDDAVAQFWLSLTGKDSARNLARWAHRNSLDAPRPVDSEFLSIVDGMQSLLERLMAEFEARWSIVGQRLDTHLRRPQPSKSDAATVAEAIPRDLVAHAYFFERAGAVWLEPLTKVGFFASPPAPEIDEDDGTVVLPFWPESRYLARVAAEAPEAAVSAASAIPRTQNSRINFDIVSVAVAVPAEYAVRLIDRILDELRTGAGVYLPQQVVMLCARLAADGYRDEAADLLRALLEKIPALGGTTGFVDTYTYGEILRSRLPIVTDHAGRAVLDLLVELLARAVAEETTSGSGQRHAEWSTVWRPSLEGPAEHEDFDPVNALVSAVRDTALHLMAAMAHPVTEIVGLVEAAGGEIFRRLGLYLLAHHGQSTPELVTAHLLDSSLLTDPSVISEYLLLAHGQASILVNPTCRHC